MSKSIAIFPASFDPLHLGHKNIAIRSSSMFDEVILVIAENIEKESFYSVQDRKVMLERTFKGHGNIKIMEHDDLMVDLVEGLLKSKRGRKPKIFFLRGLRCEGDYQYEAGLAFANKALSKDNKVETVFLMADPSFVHISSTLIRDAITYGRDCSQFVPKEVHDIIKYREVHPYAYLLDQESRNKND